MTINGFAHHDGDLDVPDWMKPLDGTTKPPRTIRGEVVDKPAVDLTKPAADVLDDEDDLAPGVIEYVPYRRPVVSRSASAAMVAASATGRGGWAVTRWLCHGLAASTILGWRYVRAHDHIESLGGMDGPKWSKVHQTRHQRWGFLGKLAGGLTLADLLAWWGLDQGAGFGTLEALATAPTVEAIAAGAALTLYGRYRLNAKLAPTEIVAAEDIDDGEEPFPLAWCKDGVQVQDCVRRALEAEGVDTRSITVLGNRGWGWEIDLQLKGSTPGRVNAAADQLDSHFDIQQGGTLIEPDPAKAAHVVLRLVTSDPFDDMARPTVHAPNSLSVRDVAVYGRGMDGAPLEFRLRGMSMLIIGSSGAAKTKGALRCLAETITACRDAIAIEMDPVKDGLTEFADAMALPPIRGGKACTERLQQLVDIASARNKIKTRKEMGDLWEPSPEDPTIYGIVDEFIFLPDEAKELAIQLLRIGRETGVHLIFAAQEATKDALGDAVASAVTYRVLLASRSEDILLVFGKGASAAGYRPDRLRPAVDDERVYDAGKFYIQGPGFLRPIQWRWNRFDRDQIRQAVKDRKAAGRPWFDYDSLAAADLLHVITRDGHAVESIADRLDRLDDPRAGKIAALLRLFDDHRAAWLPSAVIAAAGVEEDSARLQALLAELVPMAKSSKEYVDGKQARGWERRFVDQAAAALFAPS
jgi:S-DNA-T family DNA segregation ATPase FtsK/SpoIIIE